jgi:adenylosuccinate lyase
MLGARHILEQYDPVSVPLAEATQRQYEALDPSLLMSPEDGRYSEQLAKLAPYVNEAALVRMRLIVEAEWFCHLLLHVLPPDILDAEGRQLADRVADVLRELGNATAIQTVHRTKEVEDKTKHDVIAMITACREYVERVLIGRKNPVSGAIRWIRKRIFGAKIADEKMLSTLLSYVHLGLTSEDINSPSHSLILLNACNRVLRPQAEKMIAALRARAADFANVEDPQHPGASMGARFARYATDLEQCLPDVVDPRYLTVKFSGATGTHAALQAIARPGVDARAVAASFVEHIVPQCQYLPVTAQINPHDDLSLWCGATARLSATMQRICQEIWDDSGFDVEIGGDLQKLLSITPDAGASGSSAMPHKIQVINIENAIGTAKLLKGRMQGLQRTINVNRLQRELSDSVCIRDLFGDALPKLLHMFQNVTKDLDKLKLSQRVPQVDVSALKQELPPTTATIPKGNLLEHIRRWRLVLDTLARRDANIAMLARTHNQPASPTTLGKEWKVFAQRFAYLEDVCTGRIPSGCFTDDIEQTAIGILEQLAGDVRLYNDRGILLALPQGAEHLFQLRLDRRSLDMGSGLTMELPGAVVVHSDRAHRELQAHFESLAEAVQTTLRCNGVPDAYEIVRAVTRGAQMNQQEYRSMIERLLADVRVPAKTREEVGPYLLNLTPQQFTGLAADLAVIAR